MSQGFTVWYVLAGIVAVGWLFVFRALASVARRRKVLTARSHPGPWDHPPKVSVLVAAKDEEDTIETCLTTLLTQDYPNLEIIAIDDRSTDRTPDILRALQQRAGDKLRVVTVDRLADGWFGKNNAMREGVSVSTGDWLCFIDADCRQTSPRTISVAVREAIERDIDLLTITPVLEARSTWERIIQPLCSAILIVRFRPSRANRRRSSIAYANGQFMLFSRRCYDAIGGHHAVRNRINEDIHLAKAVKGDGHKLRVMENQDLYQTRMYRTPREAWRGWSRIYHGCFESIPRLLAVAASTLCFIILPWVALVAAVIGTCAADGTDASRPWATAALLTAIAVAALQIAMARFYHTFLRFDRRWSLTCVVGAIVAVGMLGSAMLKTIGATTTTWRGTTYRRDRVEEAAEHA
ncbi:MAG: glycosyltransferase [Phycisphaerae bacterium]